MLTKRLHSFTFAILFLSAAAYSSLIYSGGTAHPAADSISADAAQGKLLYQQYNCQACHQLYGLGGYLGPDLTNVISAPGKGEDYAKSFMIGGTARMPNFHLSQQQVNQLAEYLKYVDKTGSFPIYKPEITLWGNINLPVSKQKNRN